MGLHERAWDGIQLVILAKTPMLAMQIEQSIAAASPANELKVESFEDYKSAFDFCKTSQNVGFLILEESLGALPVIDAFRQLAKPREDAGWPCFGALVHAGVESVSGYRAIQSCPEILEYVSSQALLDGTLIFQTLRDLWEKYVQAFETFILPQALQDSILELVAPEFPENHRLFRNRTLHLLTANLNLTWIEYFALQWEPTIRALQASNQSFWTTLRVPRQLCALAEPTSPGLLDDLVRTESPLCRRTATLAELLLRNWREGSLAQFLDTLDIAATPGSPALLRHASKHRNRILEIASNCSDQLSTRRAG